MAERLVDLDCGACGIHCSSARGSGGLSSAVAVLGSSNKSSALQTADGVLLRGDPFWPGFNRV